MELKYRLQDGVFVLDTPAQIDITNGILAINFANTGNARLFIDGNYTDIINGKAVIDAKKLKKGTIILKVVYGNVDKPVFVPCQPLDLFDFNNKIKCKLATSLDVLRTLNVLQDKYYALEKRVENIEKSNPKGTKDAVNNIVEAFAILQNRVEELEKNYDPTLI